MGKLLLWFVIVLVVMMVARLISANKLRDSASPGGSRGRRAKPPPPARVEHMVRCAQCGIHLPRSEAVLSGGNTYCGPEHARLGVSADHD